MVGFKLKNVETFKILKNLLLSLLYEFALKSPNKEKVLATNLKTLRKTW